MTFRSGLNRVDGASPVVLSEDSDRPFVLIPTSPLEYFDRHTSRPVRPTVRISPPRFASTAAGR